MPKPRPPTIPCNFFIIIIVCVPRVSLFSLLAEQSKLEELVGELAQGLAVVKHEQEYMEVRERIHRMSESDLCAHV